MNSRTKLLAVGSLLLLSFSLGQAKAQDMNAADNWAKEKLSQMTLDEKIAIISGINGMDTKTIERLGISKIHMSDGPQGVREENSTAYPCAVMLAASWNDKLAHDYGYAMPELCTIAFRTPVHLLLTSASMNITPIRKFLISLYLICSLK